VTDRSLAEVESAVRPSGSPVADTVKGGVPQIQSISPTGWSIGRIVPEGLKSGRVVGRSSGEPSAGQTSSVNVWLP